MVNKRFSAAGRATLEIDNIENTGDRAEVPLHHGPDVELARHVDFKHPLAVVEFQHEADLAAAFRPA